MGYDQAAELHLEGTGTFHQETCDQHGEGHGLGRYGPEEHGGLHASLVLSRCAAYGEDQSGKKVPAPKQVSAKGLEQGISSGSSHCSYPLWRQNANMSCQVEKM